MLRRADGTFPPLHRHGAEELRAAAATYTGDETLVQQHLRDEVDVNTIMRRFQSGGSLPLGAVAPGVYGDFSGVEDFESARDLVRRAEEGFLRLPAEVRDRFGNDPGNLIRAAHSLPLDEFAPLFAGEEAAAPAVVTPLPEGSDS